MVEILKRVKHVLAGSGPVVASISALRTADAVDLARAVYAIGVDGLMVLPPYVCQGDWREIENHLSAVFCATPLSCMLYKNPIAYGTDITSEQILLLQARHQNFHAVKESSGDIRRITALKRTAHDRRALFAGMDDVVVESVAAGAVGWIAGLVNALPHESVQLFELPQSGPSPELHELYAWCLPLLRLDAVPKFLQLIKLVQAEVGGGSARVRLPRLEIRGSERDEVLALIRTKLQRGVA